MQVNRVGNSGFMISDLVLGTFEWGHRVSAATAQELLAAYAQGGGSLVEVPSGNGPALDILAGLRIPAGLSVLTRVGLTDDFSISNGRSTLLQQVAQMRSALRVDHLDLVVLDAFDEHTPLEETASAVDTLLTRGDIAYVGAAHHSGWQLAVTRAAGIELVASVSELSLLAREAEETVLPAADYLGVGVIAGAALGRGVLAGKYLGGIPGDSRAAHSTSAYVGPYLQEEYARIVAGAAKAASSLGVKPVDVALAWNRALGVAGNIVAPRTVEQLRQLVSSNLVLEPEIIEVLGEVSEL